ncbi:hypothetical protein XENOCAPTIV_027636, partial [Xenoophorus captivus]
HSGHSSPREESSSSATSPSSQSSVSPGPKSFYPRQGAQSKYLIGWRKPGSTINSVDFGDTRNRRRSLHRTLSDESIYRGQRLPSLSDSVTEPALSTDVLFSCSTLPRSPTTRGVPLRRPSYKLGVKLHGKEEYGLYLLVCFTLFLCLPIIYSVTEFLFDGRMSLFTFIYFILSFSK